MLGELHLCWFVTRVGRVVIGEPAAGNSQVASLLLSKRRANSAEEGKVQWSLVRCRPESQKLRRSPAFQTSVRAESNGFAASVLRNRQIGRLDQLADTAADAILSGQSGLIGEIRRLIGPAAFGTRFHQARVLGAEVGCDRIRSNAAKNLSTEGDRIQNFMPKCFSRRCRQWLTAASTSSAASSRSWTINWANSTSVSRDKRG
jgi:hypothetical protein